MDHDLTLISTAAMGVLAALVGGFVARRIGIPVIVGYLLGGVLVGPSTPGFVADHHAAQQFAELGVIFMMFGVGLHFSLRDLLSVKNVAIPGALLQMTLATGAGAFIAHELWGWTLSASLVLGLAVSIASTVVLLRGLTDRNLLTTSGGRTAVGWLVLEDLATVAILVLLPAIVGDSTGRGTDVGAIAWALGKAVLFIALVLIVGVRLLPWLLTAIARTRSRELFLLAVFSLAAGTAYGAYELFGVSLALGAFLAGVVMAGSSVHHQVEAEVSPFRDIFAVLFFVSVGMQVDLDVVTDQFAKVLLLVALVVVGKTVLTLAFSVLMPRAGRDLVVVAAGLSQIGEFSFIIGQAGMSLDLITADQYALILAAAVLSIMVNPLMFGLMPITERMLLRAPFVGERMRRADPGIDIRKGEHEFRDHVVIVGYGRVGRRTAQVLRELDAPLLIVDIDTPTVERAEREGLDVLFGDASNSDILTHAGLGQAEALVVTVPSQTAAELIVAAAHDLAPHLPIIARAGSLSGVQRLHELGARHVINPELEGGLEIVRHAVLELDVAMNRVQPYVDAVRHEAYQGHFDSDGESAEAARALDQLLSAVRGVDLAWHSLPDDSPLAGLTLVEADVRRLTGASVVAIVRDGEVVTNPAPDTTLAAGDLLGLIGSDEQLRNAGAQLQNDTIST